MSKSLKSETIYFESDIYQALINQAKIWQKSLSELVNDYARLYLHEDQEDQLAFEERKNESTLSYKALLQSLKE